MPTPDPLYPADHAAGALSIEAYGIPGFEVGVAPPAGYDGRSGATKSTRGSAASLARVWIWICALTDSVPRLTRSVARTAWRARSGSEPPTKTFKESVPTGSESAAVATR